MRSTVVGTCRTRGRLQPNSLLLFFMRVCWRRWALGSVVAAAHALTITPAHAQVPISEAAARRFEEGVHYLESKTPDRFQRAYIEFKAAYADSPSWQVLGNLGIVAQELERYGEAIDAYRGYLQGGGKKLSSRERKQFQRDLSLLESDLATLTLQTNPEGAWIVDERVPDTGPPVVNRYGPLSGALELRVRPGHHRIHAELSGYASETWEIDGATKTSAAHRFELRAISSPAETRVPASRPVHPPPQPEDPGQRDGLDSDGKTNGLRILSYAALGLGTLGLGTGVWFAIRQDSTASEADRAFKYCTALRTTPGVCDVNRLDAAGHRDAYAVKAQELDARESNQRKAALIGFVAGGALIASGLVFFFTSAGSPESGEEVRFVPWVSPTGVGLTAHF